MATTAATNFPQGMGDASYNATDDILDFYQNLTSPQRTTFEPSSRPPSSMSLATTYEEDRENITPVLRRTKRHLRPRPLSMAALDNNSGPENEILSMSEQYPAIRRASLTTPDYTNRLVGRPRTNTTTGASNNFATRRTSLPYAPNHRHSLSSAGLSLGASSASGINSSNFSSQQPYPHNNNNTDMYNSRPRSGVWDEIEAVRERIQRLKATKTNSNGSLSSSKPTQTSLHSYKSTSSEDRENTTPLPTGNESVDGDEEEEDDDDYEPTMPLDDQEGMSQSQQDEQQDWEQQEPVSSIMMSSPVPSSYSRTFENDTSSHSASPTLTRQSPAEKHLLEVIDRARRVRDHDYMVVLLERVVTDTMSLYNHCEARQGESIDRVCLSLSDFILQFLEQSEEPQPMMPVHQPQQLSRRQYTSPKSANNTNLHTPMRRLIPTTANSVPRPATSNGMWHEHSSPYGGPSTAPTYARVRNEYLQNSPLNRSTTSPMVSANQRRRTSRRFEPSPDYAQKRSSFF